MITASYSELVDRACLVKEPLVSVVMLTYNHERYLGQAVEGVVRQETGFALELLIGEDCSTDGTRAIAMDYQKRFPGNIRVITSEQNVGMHKNLERLIAAARGKYIAFCEGDDFWHRTDKLRKQIEILEERSEVSVVCTDFRVVSDNGTLLAEKRGFPLVEEKDHFTFEELVSHRAFVLTASLCTRRDLILDCMRKSPECQDHTLPMGDLPLYLELSQRGTVRYLPESLVTYRLSENSAMRKTNPHWARRFQMEARDTSYRFLNRYPVESGPGKTRLYQIEFARLILRTAVLLGERARARTQLTRLKGLQAMGLSDLLTFAAVLLPFRPIDAAQSLGLIPLWRGIRRARRAWRSRGEGSLAPI